jgi:hypothetical protein
VTDFYGRSQKMLNNEGTFFEVLPTGMRMKAQMIIPLVVGFPPDYNVLGNYNM